MIKIMRLIKWETCITSIFLCTISTSDSRIQFTDDKISLMDLPLYNFVRLFIYALIELLVLFVEIHLNFQS